MNQKLKNYGPAILWALFICIICNLPMGEVGAPEKYFPGFDKIVHCGLFFVMQVFMVNGYLRSKGLAVLPVGPAFFMTLEIIFFGGVIELVQTYIFVWRSGDWNDLFCDGVGACMATFSILLTTYTVKYVKQ